MAKFLVTGANGQVGYCLTQQLLGRHELFAVGKDQLDITDRAAVFETIEHFRPDIVINAAAYTAVDRAESEPELAAEINAYGAGYLAEAAQHVGAAILHLSTDYVFDGKKQGLYQEEDQPYPQSVYGQTKLAGEQAVVAANQKYIVMRTAWVFGERGHNFVKTMLRLAKTRESLGIVADQFGAPTYAGDIAQALIHIAEQILSGKPVEYGVYHFTGFPYVSWATFAETIFAQAVSQKCLEKAPLVQSITSAEYPTAAQRPANSRLAVAKIQQQFGIQPSDWQAALCNLGDYLE